MNSTTTSASFEDQLDGISNSLVAIVSVVGSLVTLIGGILVKLKINRSKCGFGKCLAFDIVMNRDEMEMVSSMRDVSRDIKREAKTMKKRRFSEVKQTIQSASPSQSEIFNTPTSSLSSEDNVFMSEQVSAAQTIVDIDEAIAEEDYDV
jgi:hypothetical protein